MVFSVDLSNLLLCIQVKRLLAQLLPVHVHCLRESLLVTKGPVRGAAGK